MTDYEKMQKSLKCLQEQYDNCQNLDEGFPEYLKESILDSVIHRYKVCFSMLYKTLGQYLIDVLDVVEVQSGPKSVLSMANEYNLLESSEEQWFEYAQTRVDVSYDFDGKKAEACLALVPGFIEDASSLYRAMSGEKWN